MRAFSSEKAFFISLRLHALFASINYHHDSNRKKAARIRTRILFFTAIASAIGGFILAKKCRTWRAEEDDDARAMDKGDALKDIVSAGLDLKRAWKRIRRDVKIIGQGTIAELQKGDDSEDDDDEEDEEDD